MKQRWIGGLLLTIALSLGGCAPPSQGDDPSQAGDLPPSGPTSTDSSAEPTEGEGPSSSAEPGGYDDDY